MQLRAFSPHILVVTKAIVGHGRLDRARGTQLDRRRGRHVAWRRHTRAQEGERGRDDRCCGADVLLGKGNNFGRDCSGRGLCDYSSGLCKCFQVSHPLLSARSSPARRSHSLLLSLPRATSAPAASPRPSSPKVDRFDSTSTQKVVLGKGIRSS